MISIIEGAAIDMAGKPDSEAKKKWMKENTTTITVRLNHNQDKELVEFMQGKPGAATIKKALHLLMEQEEKK